MFYKNFLESSSKLKIEVESKDGTSNALSPSFTSSLSGIASLLSGQLKNLPSENKPSNCEITFGLKALASGDFCITIEPAKASFIVTMKWENSVVEEIMPPLPV
ncbi:MAG TPA: CU044_2847 family protein [Chitinophagaceae bacterium]